jgi:dTDP-4-dehydrorhamnose reductase
MKPSVFYSKTKALGEESVLASGCKHLILRTSWLYSSYGNNFLKTMLRIGKERDSVRVVSDQTGTPTYAADLAKAILLIMAVTIQKPELCGIYHISNEGTCSWYDFAHEIMKAENLNCKVFPIATHEYPLPSPRPFYSVMSKALVCKTFGIEMPHWRDAMLRCLKKLKG